jgi:drug/metabolite transporter, DME family
VASTLGVLAGGYRLFFEGLGELSFGASALVAGCGSATGYSLYVITADANARRGRRQDPWVTTFFVNLSGLVVFAFWSPPWALLTVDLGAPAYLALFYVGVVGTVIPFMLYFASLHYIEGLHASVTTTLKPVFGAVVAFLVLGQALSAREVLGALCIIASVVAVQLSQAERGYAAERVQQAG